MVRSLDIENITPLHEARSQRHLRDLTADMKENGWRERPLLVIERDTDFVAWTGSHRLAAAKLAGLNQVPCYVLSESRLESQGYDAEQGVEDWERLKILQELGDETALSIMWQENRQ